MNNKFENSRYIPVVKTILQDILTSSIDEQFLPWIRPPPDNDATSSMIDARFGTIKSTKSSWATKKSTVGPAITASHHPASPSQNFKGPRIIVFMLGGVSHSEIRSAYECMEGSSREIIIGKYFIHF